MNGFRLRAKRCCKDYWCYRVINMELKNGMNPAKRYVKKVEGFLRLKA